MSEPTKVNRLIIIGNGFDLAHGYKTSYKDFLFHIIYNRLLEFKQALESQTYSEHTKNPEFFFRVVLGPTEYPNRIKEIIAFEQQIKENNENLFAQLQAFIKKSGFDLIILSELIKKIYKDTTIKNWVDIEETYYTLIKKTEHHKQGLTLNESEVMAIKMLNDSLTFLTSELQTYLTDITLEKITIHNMVMKFVNKSYETTYIINFNYTSTFIQYFEKNTKYEIINIHGRLNDKDNPIIFGLGDESHSLYPQIVESNIDEMLHNVKSLKYLETNNYAALKLAIDETLFDVDVIGHSCGISDRTLLKEVFNHKNCCRINLYHYKGLGSYKESIYGASRYFDSNYKMRQKVKSFNPKLTIPQI